MENRQGVNQQDDERTSLVFSVRGPIPIQLDDSSSNWWSGSSVLDLIFPQPETVSEIRLRNWYTARLSLLVRFDDSVQAPPKREHLAWAAAATLSLAKLRGVESTEGIKIGRNLASTNRNGSDWVVSLQNKVLMTDPHTESGSQDVVVISATESLVSLHDVTALRFLLRQPSPNWRTFNVEEITVYRDPLIKARTPNPSSSSASTTSDSGMVMSSMSATMSSNSANRSSTFIHAQQEDQLLDQLGRQTASALKLGSHILDDDSTTSSSDGVPNSGPPGAGPVAIPMTYDIMSLNF